MNLNKNQYKILLMMMYCGEWVINSHKIKKDKIQSETESLEQYIFSFAKEYGFDKFIEYDEDLKTFFPTADMEEKFHGFIDKYDLKQMEK
jgi:hypothetical protein